MKPHKHIAHIRKTTQLVPPKGVDNSMCKAYVDYVSMWFKTTTPGSDSPNK